MKRLLSLIALGLFCGALAANAEAPKYKDAPFENGGTIKGRVTFKGEAPDLKLVVNQDVQHCNHTDGFQKSPRLKVAKEGGVAETIVYLKNIATGKRLEELKVAGELDQIGCQYVPFTQVIPYRSKLKILTSDPVLHNVNGRLEGKQEFNYGMPNPSYPKKHELLTKTLYKDGIYEVNCDAHMWMNAYVWVVRHPYYAVTDEAGNFELTNVPPGEYEIAAWHAGWDAEPKKNPQGLVIGYDYSEPVEKTAKVTVAPGGETKIGFVINE